MSVGLALNAPAPVWTRRLVAGAVLLGLAAALSIAIFTRRDDLSSGIGAAANKALNSIKTVAEMLANRSPGERPEGALASLKHKRPMLHQRALPKVRLPVPPLIDLVSPPPPVDIVPPAPLYSMVSGPPGDIVPPPPGGGSPPPGIDIPPPGIIVPPSTPPVTPPENPPPAVPEPNSWAMMLLGFGLMGWAIRRDQRTVARAAAS